MPGSELDRLIERDVSRRLSSWRLYSWMRLICTSNSAAGSTTTPSLVADHRERSLFARLTLRRIPLERRVRGKGLSRELVDLRRCTSPHRLAQTSGSVRPGLALQQPAARRDAVGLVGDAVGIELVEIGAKTVSFISSECSAETPLTCASRRRRDWPCARAGRHISSISEIEERSTSPGRAAPRVEEARIDRRR
jgi:hypothetical protein